MVPVSVNVSRLSMFGSTTVEFLKELVQKYEIAPDYLRLELLGHAERALYGAKRGGKRGVHFYGASAEQST